MKQDDNLKTCEFCGQKFVADNPRKKYCKQSCKARAWELRQGKEAPAFLVGNEYDIVQKEIKTSIENPEYIQLHKINQTIASELSKIEQKRNQTKNEIDKYKNDQGIAFGAFGGGGLGFLASRGMENDFGKVMITLGGSLLGLIIGSESEEAKRNRVGLLNSLIRNLRQLEANHSEYNKQFMFNKMKLLSTPEKIEKTEIKEIKVPKRQGLVRKHKKNAPFITASELSGMEFDLYELDGKFKHFLGSISINAFITCFGQPGSGKSTFFVQLADYFAKFGMVVYVTPEEGVSPTFKQKLTCLNISNDNLHITADTSLKAIRNALKNYDYKFCFIDSINMLSDASAQELETVRKDFPEVLFAIIMQSTKDGKFKGSNEYAHNSDINIKVEQGMASTIKNRFNELGDFEIFKNS